MSPDFDNDNNDDDAENVDGFDIQTAGASSYYKNMCSSYPCRILIGLKDRWWLAILFLIFALLLSVGSVVSSCNFCLTFSPETTSTSLTRHWFEKRYCTYGTICYLYATVPEDLSTSLIINYQIYGSSPTNTHAMYSVDGSQWNNAKSTCFWMSEIVDEERYQCWADLTTMQANTTYFVYATSTWADGSHFNTTVRKFRTAPAVEDANMMKIASGGDFAWYVNGIRLCQFAQTQEPLFAIVGGDIAYENGVPFCYRRMDEWFTNWETYMTTSSNYSIPILTAIGNHESGNFMQPRDKDAFYIRYFPHQIGLSSLHDPNTRALQHVHLLGNNTIIFTLDSWVHETPESQVAWLKNTLEKYADRSNKIAIYHVSIYPGKPMADNDATWQLVNAQRTSWLPLFEQHNVKIGMEHHFHYYKATFPILNGTKVEMGTPGATVYLGGM